MDNKQPEALRLADECDDGMVDFAEAAAELRRLHDAVNGLKTLADIRSDRIAALEQALGMAVEALESLANTFHEGNARPIEGACGYVDASVEQAEAALAAARQTLGGKHD